MTASDTQWGHCIFCQRPVNRPDRDQPWRDPEGRWRCPQHPRAGESRITPHQAV